MHTAGGYTLAALVQISARYAIARVPSVTCARMAAIGIRAPCQDVAIVKAERTLVDVVAKQAAANVAVGAGARERPASVGAASVDVTC